MRASAAREIGTVADVSRSDVVRPRGKCRRSDAGRAAAQGDCGAEINAVDLELHGARRCAGTRSVCCHCRSEHHRLAKDRRVDGRRQRRGCRRPDDALAQRRAGAGQEVSVAAVDSGDGVGGSAVQGGTLSDEWSALKPQITPRGLQRSSGVADQAMDLVFRIERQTSLSCGAPSGPDLALLLISKLREGSKL